MYQLNIPSLGKTVKNNYITTVYETNPQKALPELIAANKVHTISYDKISEKQINGTFCGSFRDDEGKLIAAYTERQGHLLCVGGTGSGKTTGCVEPTLRFLSGKNNKPTLMVTDPKGDLFSRNANYLKKMGYRLACLNFKDVSHSSTWNPLSEIYDSWIRQNNLKVIAFNADSSKLSEYTLQDRKDAFNKAVGFWSVQEKAFPNAMAAQQYITVKEAVILSETEDLINQLVHSLIPDSMVSSNDPTWVMGAQSILKGLIYLMAEDALDERSGLTKDNFNLMAVSNYYNAIRNDCIDATGCTRPLCQSPKLRHKKPTDESIKHLKPYFETAPTTAKCYLGTFSNAMGRWFNTKIFTICNGNNLRLQDDDDSPFAVFLITREYEKTDNTIAGLFVDYIYRAMLKKAEKQGGSLQNEMHFILEEFGNIPHIDNFENKISTSRSRNIWFQMFVQSYAQLDVVYGDDCSKIIRDNCNIHVFLGSNNFITKQTFSNECGRKIVPVLSSIANPEEYQLKEMPLVSITALESLEPGSMYIRINGFPLIETHFERSYLCPEFNSDEKTTPQDFGFMSDPFNCDKYYYHYLSSPLSMKEYGNKSEREQERKQKDNYDIDLYQILFNK